MNKKTNRKLYFAGVGPGDPELLTLKSVRLVASCDVLFAPVRTEKATDSMALDIVKQAMNIDGKRVVYLYLPMVKGAENIISAAAPAALEIQHALSPGETGVFVTLGCATVYSTGGNLFRALRDTSISLHFVPGVSSISATAASSGGPLAYSEEKIAVFPAIYSMDQVASSLKDFETVVLMKAHSCMDVLRQLLDGEGLLGTSIMVEKASTQEETVRCLADMPAGYQPHYMSTIIIRK